MALYIPHEDSLSWVLGCEVECVVVERGDVVLRRGVDDWPDYVPWDVDFTHAGIGVVPRQTVVDACPLVDGRRHVVDRVGVDDFLDAARAPEGGAVYRLCSRVDKPQVKKVAAAKWAEGQVHGNYCFDPLAAMNPEAAKHVGDDPVPIYCSQFVYHAYSVGAQLELVLPQDRIDIKAPENLEATVSGIIDLLRRNDGKAAKVPKKLLRKEVLDRLAFLDGWVVLPDCLAKSPFLECVAVRDGKEMSHGS